MIDDRPFIRVHDGLPDHPKVVGLSDRAFRVLIESWCWCSRHLTDGHIPAAYWRRTGTARARAELVSAGLVEQVADGVMMHDYLLHQRSAAQVDEYRAARQDRGSLGNHVRWHASKGITRPGCPHCRIGSTGPRSTRPTESRKGKVACGSSAASRANREEAGSVNNSVDESVDNTDLPDSTCEKSPAPGSGHAQGRSQEGSSLRSLDDPSDSQETEEETEVEDGDLRSPYEDGSVDHHQDRYAGARAREEPHPLAAVVVAELLALTGRHVSDDHASTVARRVLDGRQVTDPRAYLVAALRGEPAAFLPTGGDPAHRPLREALADALARHACPHGAVRPERCPTCRRPRPAPHGGPTATSISDEDTSQARASDHADGPADGQANDTTDPEGDPAP